MLFQRPDADVPDETELAQMLGDLLQEPVRVRRRVARYIAPEASGKYRLVVSHDLPTPATITNETAKLDCSRNDAGN